MTFFDSVQNYLVHINLDLTNVHFEIATVIIDCLVTDLLIFIV